MSSLEIRNDRGLLKDDDSSTYLINNSYQSPKSKHTNIINNQTRKLLEKKLSSNNSLSLYHKNQSNLKFDLSNSTSKIELKNQEQSEVPEEEKPVEYKGGQIFTYRDILKHLQLSPKDNKLQEQDSNIASSSFFDEKYLELINKVRPKMEYYRQGLGDKLLFLSRVDKIHYDIIEAERKRKEFEQQDALQKARQELEDKEK